MSETFDWTDPDTGRKHSHEIPDGLPTPHVGGETLADIVAEMRSPEVARCVAAMTDVGAVMRYLDAVADRIEAAAKRERDIMHDSDKWDAFVQEQSVAAYWRERCHDAEERVNKCGNVAKLREAVGTAIRELKMVLESLPFPRGRYINRYSKTMTTRSKVDFVIGILEKALAATPRNCDRPEFKNGEDAWLAFEKENPDWCENHQSKSFWCDDCESAGCDRCMADWLMSQATTEKGGAECQQK